MPDIFLPDALARKYKSAATQFGWYWIFSCGRPSLNPRAGKVRRHHVSPSYVQRLVRDAGRSAGIEKAISPSYTMTFVCYSFVIEWC